MRSHVSISNLLFGLFVTKSDLRVEHLCGYLTQLSSSTWCVLLLSQQLHEHEGMQLKISYQKAEHPVEGGDDRVTVVFVN